METRKSKRSVRLALVLSAAVAGTALVGWGGLAAWQAYTQNAGNAFTTGSIGHTNQVSGKTLVCQSTTAEFDVLRRHRDRRQHGLQLGRRHRQGDDHQYGQPA